MNKADVERAVRRALPSCSVYVGSVQGGGFKVDIDGSFVLTFQALSQMSDELGTKLIDVDHMEGEPGYSEHTPASLGRVCLNINQQKGIGEGCQTN